MTTINLHFEKHPDHDLLTPANSNDFGDDPIVAEARGSMDVWYDATIAAHGTGSILYWEAGNTGDGYAAEYFGDFNATQAVMRFYIRFTGFAPSGSGAGIGIAAFRSADSSEFSTLYLFAGGLVSFHAVGMSGNHNSTVALAANTWYRVEHAMKLSSAVGQSDGQAKWAIYTGDATASSLISFDTGATLNTNASGITGKTINSSVVGKLYGGALIPKYNVDDWSVQDGTTTYLGPYTPGPVLITNANQGVAVIDCTQSYAGITGDSITYSISPSTGTSQPARGVFLVPEKPDSTNYTITATESNGKTDVQTVIVPPQLPGGLGFTTKRYSSGAWV